MVSATVNMLTMSRFTAPLAFIIGLAGAHPILPAHIAAGIPTALVTRETTYTTSCVQYYASTDHGDCFGRHCGPNNFSPFQTPTHCVTVPVAAVAVATAEPDLATVEERQLVSCQPWPACDIAAVPEPLPTPINIEFDSPRGSDMNSRLLRSLAEAEKNKATVATVVAAPSTPGLSETGDAQATEAPHVVGVPIHGSPILPSRLDDAASRNLDTHVEADKVEVNPTTTTIEPERTGLSEAADMSVYEEGQRNTEKRHVGSPTSLLPTMSCTPFPASSVSPPMLPFPEVCAMPSEFPFLGGGGPEIPGDLNDSDADAEDRQAETKQMATPTMPVPDEQDGSFSIAGDNLPPRYSLSPRDPVHEVEGRDFFPGLPPPSPRGPVHEVERRDFIPEDWFPGLPPSPLNFPKPGLLEGVRLTPRATPVVPVEPIETAEPDEVKPYPGSPSFGPPIVPFLPVVPVPFPPGGQVTTDPVAPIEPVESAKPSTPAVRPVGGGSSIIHDSDIAAAGAAGLGGRSAPVSAEIEDRGLEVEDRQRVPLTARDDPPLREVPSRPNSAYWCRLWHEYQEKEGSGLTSCPY